MVRDTTVFHFVKLGELGDRNAKVVRRFIYTTNAGLLSGKGDTSANGDGAYGKSATMEAEKCYRRTETSCRSLHSCKRKYGD